MATYAADPNAFCIGGSGPHYGVGLIIGPREAYGLIKDSTTDIDGVVAILTFTDILNASEPPAHPTAQ